MWYSLNVNYKILWQNSRLLPIQSFLSTAMLRRCLDTMISQLITYNFNCQNTARVQQWYPCSSHQQTSLQYFPRSQVKFPDWTFQSPSFPWLSLTFQVSGNPIEYNAIFQVKVDWPVVSWSQSWQLAINFCMAGVHKNRTTIHNSLYHWRYHHKVLMPLCHIRTTFLPYQFANF